MENNRPGKVEKLFWLLALSLFILLLFIQLLLISPDARYLLTPVEKLEGTPLSNRGTGALFEHRTKGQVHCSNGLVTLIKHYASC